MIPGTYNQLHMPWSNMIYDISISISISISLYVYVHISISISISISLYVYVHIYIYGIVSMVIHSRILQNSRLGILISTNEYMKSYQWIDDSDRPATRCIGNLPKFRVFSIAHIINLASSMNYSNISVVFLTFKHQIMLEFLSNTSSSK